MHELDPVEAQELKEILSRNYVFHGLPAESIEWLADLARIKQIAPGQELVRVFDMDSDMYVMIEGHAEVRSPSGEPLAAFGPGSIVGEVSLIDEGPRSATVMCNSEGRVAVIPANVIRGMMEAEPAFARTVLGNIARVLCGRLRAMNIQLDSLTASKG